MVSFKQRLYIKNDIACDIVCDLVFGAFVEIKELMFKEIEKFRQHGALDPEKAMTIEELGLSPKFKTFLKRSPRLLGIFVSVNGKNITFQRNN